MNDDAFMFIWFLDAWAAHVGHTHWSKFNEIHKLIQFWHLNEILHSSISLQILKKKERWSVIIHPLFPVKLLLFFKFYFAEGISGDEPCCSSERSFLSRETGTGDPTFAACRRLEQQLDRNEFKMIRWSIALRQYLGATILVYNACIVSLASGLGCWNYIIISIKWSI